MFLVLISPLPQTDYFGKFFVRKLRRQLCADRCGSIFSAFAENVSHNKKRGIGRIVRYGGAADMRLGVSRCPGMT